MKCPNCSKEMSQLPSEKHESYFCGESCGIVLFAVIDNDEKKLVSFEEYKEILKSKEVSNVGCIQ